MKITKSHIYNMSLIHLGVSARVQDTSQNDSDTTVLNDIYEVAKEQVLTDFDWNFARHKTELIPFEQMSIDINYEFMYNYPNDCLCCRYLTDNSGKAKKFDVATISSGDRCILSSVKPAFLFYTRNISSELYAEPETYFSADFVMSLSYYLASVSAVAITGSEEKANNNYKKYRLSLSRAMVNNASEYSKTDEDDTTYLDARN